MRWTAGGSKGGTKNLQKVQVGNRTTISNKAPSLKWKVRNFLTFQQDETDWFLPTKPSDDKSNHKPPQERQWKASEGRRSCASPGNFKT